MVWGGSAALICGEPDPGDQTSMVMAKASKRAAAGFTLRLPGSRQLRMDRCRGTKRIGISKSLMNTNEKRPGEAFSKLIPTDLWNLGRLWEKSRFALERFSRTGLFQGRNPQLGFVSSAAGMFFCQAGLFRCGRQNSFTGHCHPPATMLFINLESRSITYLPAAAQCIPICLGILLLF